MRSDYHTNQCFRHSAACILKQTRTQHMLQTSSNFDVSGCKSGNILLQPLVMLPERSVSMNRIFAVAFQAPTSKTLSTHSVWRRGVSHIRLNSFHTINIRDMRFEADEVRAETLSSKKRSPKETMLCHLGDTPAFRRPRSSLNFRQALAKPLLI